MRYFMERLVEYTREMEYRIYVTDSLQLAPQNKYKVERYVEAIGLVKKDTRTGDEIAADVILKAGLVYGPS